MVEELAFVQSRVAPVNVDRTTIHTIFTTGTGKGSFILGLWNERFSHGPPVILWRSWEIPTVLLGVRRRILGVYLGVVIPYLRASHIGWRMWICRIWLWLWPGLHMPSAILISRVNGYPLMRPSTALTPCGIDISGWGRYIVWPLRPLRR
jgi:hypothetical protein